MSTIDLDRMRQIHQSRSLRIASVLRFGVVIIMIGAMLVGTPPAEWAKQSVLLGLYALAAIGALMSAFSRAGPSVMTPRRRFVFAIADVAVLTEYQLLSTGG